MTDRSSYHWNSYHWNVEAKLKKRDGVIKLYAAGLTTKIYYLRTFLILSLNER
jgi:hypothetical protein